MTGDPTLIRDLTLLVLTVTGLMYFNVSMINNIEPVVHIGSYEEAERW